MLWLPIRETVCYDSPILHYLRPLSREAECATIASWCFALNAFVLRFFVLHCVADGSVQCALMLIEVDTSGSMLRKTTCPNWLTVARPPSLYLSWNRQKNVAGKLIYSKNKLKKRPHAPTDFTRVVVIIFFFFLFQVQGWLCKYLTFFSTIFLSQNFDKREALTNVWDLCTSQTQTGQQWFSTILVMGPIISKRVINKVNRCLVSSSWRHSSFSSSSSASLSSSSSSLPSLYTEWASWA